MKADPADLIALRALAMRGLDWGAVARNSRLAGSSRGWTLAAGGIESAGLRPYAQGDDVRNIDWKASARLGRPMSRLFRADADRPLWIAVDQGESMQFGSRVTFKSVCAARVAAWLGWSALAGQDRVGGLVRQPDGVILARPRPGLPGVLGLVGALCGDPIGDRPNRDAQVGTTLSAALTDLARLLRGGDRVVVISDFYDLDAAPASGDIVLALDAIAQRAAVALVQVFDPIEREAPAEGVYPVRLGSATAWIDLGDPALRKAWGEILENRTASLVSLARRRGWPSAQWATSDPWPPASVWQ
jgi:uncharacterized protein (DUF58 family)